MKLLWGVIAALVACGVIASVATATDQSAWLLQGPSFLGNRSTIWSPGVGQAKIANGDFFLSSAYVDDAGVQYMIQQGITYETQASEAPSCDAGSAGPALYDFSETFSNGNYECFGESTSLGWGESHLQSVVEGNDHYWRPYVDGVFQDVRMRWGTASVGQGNCGYNACRVAAFGEESDLKPGTWPASFAGPNQTPWQYWDGAHWNSIGQNNNPSWQHTPEWKMSGPFPQGVWTMTYHR